MGCGCMQYVDAWRPLGMGCGCMQYVDTWRPLGMGCECSDCMETPVYDQMQMWRMHGDPWVWGADALDAWRLLGMGVDAIPLPYLGVSMHPRTSSAASIYRGLTQANPYKSHIF